MSGIREVLWASLLLIPGALACSGSDSGTGASGTNSATDPAIANADEGCRKFCSEQASSPLGPECLDSAGESHSLPEALCDKLCMSASCSIQAGSDPAAVKSFFDCAKSAPKSLCDTANGIAQPVGCASEQGLLGWISGWEFGGKKADCK